MRNTRNTTFLLSGELQFVVTSGLLTQASMDISTDIAIRTNPTPSLLRASLDWPRGSLIRAQHARQALSL